MMKIWLGLSCFLPIFSTVFAGQNYAVDESTGAKTWSTKENGIFFSLTQLLPDQLNAFYVNRGFSQDQIKPYVSSCIYMAVLRNDEAPGIIKFDSRGWKVIFDEKVTTRKYTFDWLRDFKEKGVVKPAQIAFRWAQFPLEQEYEPGGDWNQGMFSAGMFPGAEFDVEANWMMKKDIYTSTLKGVSCEK